MNARSVLYVLLDQARLERAQQLHFDALDGKAGILLGFAGALIALAPSGLRIALDGGRAAAVVAGYFALRTFWPRSIPITNLLVLRQGHTASDEAFRKLALVDNQIDIVRRSRVILRDKAWRLKASMASLGIASVLTAVGVSVRSRTWRKNKSHRKGRSQRRSYRLFPPTLPIRGSSISWNAV